jgi:nitronate monooxygenase
MTNAIDPRRPDWTRTPLTAKLGISYPIIQGPLGGFSTQRLAAEVSNFGGLGSFGAHGFEPGAIADVIADIRTLTSKPFAMNLWVSMEDAGAAASDEKAFQRAVATLAPHLDALGVPRPGYTPYVPVSFEAQARVLIDARVPVFSFIYGIPPKEILDECRAKGIFTIGTATTVEEAVAIEKAGADIVVASGFEAGGHRGSFLRSAEESLAGTFSLVPQVADAVDIPVVAAGGIADARGIVAAFALGADGVQMGTAFLATEESGASALHREALLSGKASRTGLTKGFTGRLARGIRNRLMDDLNQPGAEILPYPLQRGLVKHVVTAAGKVGRADLLQLWAGQNASLLRHAHAQALLNELVVGVSEAVPDARK